MLDDYVIYARIYPAILVSLPLSAPLVAIYRSGVANLEKGLIGACGLAVLAIITQIVRSAGGAAEKRLYLGWGGAPTTLLLQYRGPSRLEDVEAYHAALRKLFPDLHLPTVASERANPSAADATYERGVALLRERTRDRTRFQLLYRENRDYGFRRNCYGARWLGVVVSLAGGGVQAGLAWRQGLAWLTPETFLPSVLALGAVGLWLFICTEGWVREAADKYARQILAHLLAEASAKL